MTNKKPDPPVTRNELVKEINKLATKDDFSKLANEIVKIQSDLETKATKEDLINTETRILNAIDSFAQKAENYDRKAVFHGKRIEEHEERITHLEKTVLK